LALSAAGLIWGPEPMSPRPGLYLQRNRMLAGLAMMVVTLVLNYWVGREKPAQA
jgi:hypothetical protein